ncbi:hypothetical protein C0J52_08571 [Blattella germanica]|nr:hypothetical protein C0J52_08571 [Blattella germanica]
MPLRNPVSGDFTAKGWICVIRMVIKKTFVGADIIYITLSLLRMLYIQDSMVLPVWYPYNHTLSPIYELTNLSQNWGDYADMAQSAVMYVLITATSFLVCWPGTELTDKVLNESMSLFMFLMNVQEKQIAV